MDDATLRPSGDPRGETYREPTASGRLMLAVLFPTFALQYRVPFRNEILQ